MPAHQKTLLSFFQSVPKSDRVSEMVSSTISLSTHTQRDVPDIALQDVHCNLQGRLQVNRISDQLLCSMVKRHFPVPTRGTRNRLSSTAADHDPASSVSLDTVGNDGPPAPKKLKTECGGVPLNHAADCTGTLEHPGVTEEQGKRAQENLLKAKLIQNCRKSPLLVPKFGITWFEALEKEFSKEYFVKLSEFVTNERKSCSVFPPPEQVFTWTEHFPIRETKVVILGQDPYHGVRQAHGLCFSVQKGVPPPPSLVNIYKELANDIPGFRAPPHGNLTGWAKQGVLLLNAVLTVRSGNANSHKGRGWELFTDAVIEWLNANLTGVVFVLWGRYAQEKGGKVDKKRHCVLISAHPSPLSVTKFLGCKHFSAANNYLVKTGKKPIDWTQLAEE